MKTQFEKMRANRVRTNAVIVRNAGQMDVEGRKELNRMNDASLRLQGALDYDMTHEQLLAMGFTEATPEEAMRGTNCTTPVSPMHLSKNPLRNS